MVLNYPLTPIQERLRKCEIWSRRMNRFYLSVLFDRTVHEEEYFTFWQNDWTVLSSLGKKCFCVLSPWEGAIRTRYWINRQTWQKIQSRLFEGSLFVRKTKKTIIPEMTIICSEIHKILRLGCRRHCSRNSLWLNSRPECVPHVCVLSLSKNAITQLPQNKGSFQIDPKINISFCLVWQTRSGLGWCYGDVNLEGFLLLPP